MRIFRHRYLLGIAIGLLFSSCLDAQTFSKYWTISGTPLSVFNTDSYLALSLGRTNNLRKMMWQVNLGYMPNGFSGTEPNYEDYLFTGAIASIDLQKSIDKNFYFGVSVFGKYVSTSGYKWVQANAAAPPQRIGQFQTKLKGTNAFIFGIKSNTEKQGLCFDLSCGIGVAAKQYIVNGVQQREGVFRDNYYSAPSSIFPHVQATLRVGYRICSAKDKLVRSSK
jgi:hypothetical protein